ncbi:hypothetical protein DFJ73DRAFT_861754 [Zopfochytrium polystomum]|nr:hypothetical protein DFJ73DRAFT_861754 [Zopfochytrium polystomum]
MVYIDKQYFAAGLSVGIALVEAALAKVVSIAFLHARKPGLGLAVRLGFSGPSPWIRGFPKLRASPAVAVAIATLAVYTLLCAIRTVDTYLVATLSSPVTWSVVKVKSNKTFNLQVISGKPFVWNITAPLAATVYNGFQPPFDATGREWFALVAKTAPLSPAPVAAFNMSDVLAQAARGAAYTNCTQVQIRNLAIRDRKHHDTLLAASFGYRRSGGGGGGGSDSWTDTSRNVLIPFDASSADNNGGANARTYAFLDIATVPARFGFNLTVELVRVNYTARDALPDDTSLVGSACIFGTSLSAGNRLAAIITPASAAAGAGTPQQHVLTVSLSGLDADYDDVVAWPMTACDGLDVAAARRLMAVGSDVRTVLAETVAYYVTEPTFLSGTTPISTLLDVDLWLPGPSTGRVDYVEYDGELLDASVGLLAAVGAVLFVSLAVVAWPAVTCSNLAYALSGDAESGTGAGWTWALLVERYRHAVVRERKHFNEDVTRKLMESDLVVEEGTPYELKTVPWSEGGNLSRVVSLAKRSGIRL